MSVSQHPIALRLERQVGGATKLLATVMGLPLVDGIFPALVVANALTVPWGILQTGLLIFGGSATVAVILAEMDGSRKEQAASILLLGAILIPVAVIEAAFAETLTSMVNMSVFHRFAGLVILAVAAKTASSEVGEFLPSPSIIIGLGLLASLKSPADVQLVFSLNPDMLLRAGAAAGTGIAFALGIALAAPQLRGAVDVDRFRFGSAVALGMLAIDVLGLLPTQQPVALGVLAVTALFAYDPSGAGVPEAPTGQSSAVTDGGDDELDEDETAADQAPTVTATMAGQSSSTDTDSNARPSGAGRPFAEGRRRKNVSRDATDGATSASAENESGQRPERPPYL